MTRDELTIELDRDPPHYLPEENLSGRWVLPADLERRVRAVELSVLWSTEGIGDEDFGVYHFEQHLADEGAWLEGGRSQRFSVRLPCSPLTYEGMLIKICWCVRVRAFCQRGEDMTEATFQLGNVVPV
jgi:hypothetical protein